MHGKLSGDHHHPSAVIEYRGNAPAPRHNLMMSIPPPERKTDLQNEIDLINDAAKAMERLDEMANTPLQISDATRGALIRVIKHDLAQIARSLPNPEPHSLAEEIAAFAELESRLDDLPKP
jgi:hypothetical protein